MKNSLIKLSRKISVFFCFSVLLFSCITEIDVPVNDGSSLPVINALFSEGEKLKLYVSNIDTSSHTIELYKNDEYIETLTNKTDFYYLSESNLLSGNFYSVHVNDSENNIVISAEDSIPFPNEINDIEFILDSKYLIFNGVEGDASTVKIVIDDPEKTRDYYELLVYVIEYNQYDPNTDLVYDSIYILKDITTEDPILLAEGNKLSRNKSFVFSDELFNGKHTSINIDYFSGCSGCGYKHAVVLRTISYNYYNYMKSLLLYFNVTNLAEFESITDLGSFIFEAAPVNLYSNITNSLGIFAAYSENRFEYSIDNYE